MIDGCYVYNTGGKSTILKGTAAATAAIRNSVVLAGEGSSIIEGSGLTPENCKVLSAAQFASGEATWILNGGKDDGTQTWYQKIGKDQLPHYAMEEGNTVYGFTNCKGNLVFENAPDFESHFVIDNGSALLCKYCGETMPGSFDQRDYLCFTAHGGSVKIGMAKTGTPDDYTLQFSKSKSVWTKVQLSATNDNIVTLAEGETCYFRHGSTKETNHISNNSDNRYWSFTMTSTSNDATVEAGGNVMSLLDMTCQKNTLYKYTQHVFSRLFYNCKLLTVAPKIVTTTVGNWNFVSMFAGTSIRVAPELTATTVEDGAYYAMFENCKELVSVPALPATKLARCAYWNMFKGCDKLTSIEVANIESMVTEEGSSGRENSFHDMLAGTAVGTTGVLNMPDVMVGDNGIHLPENWIENSIDGHHYVAVKDADGNDVWEWDGLTKATLKLACTHNAKHTSVVEVTGEDITNAITTAPFCLVEGVRTYTATATVEGIEYKGSKNVVEPALGHDYHYYTCSRCGDSPSHLDEFTLNDSDPYLLMQDCTVGTFTYVRTFYTNVWNPWFVPFDMTVSDLAENGVTEVATIESIHNYDTDDDGVVDKTVLEVIKKNAGTVKAGTPYLVRTGDSYTYPMVFSEGMTLKASTDKRKTHSETLTSSYDFEGTYTGLDASQLSEGSYYSLNEHGAMVHRTQNILSQRWYMREVHKDNLYAEDSAPASARVLVIQVVGEEDETTGIRRMYDDDALRYDDDIVYDLSGRRLVAPHRGLNIINGKKINVK